MSPKQLADTNVTNVELMKVFGPTLKKNGLRYMFLNDEDLIQQIKHI